MKEVVDNKSICTKDGILSDYSIGWSKIPFKDCSIKNKFFMKKIWNRYIWIENNFIFSFFIISLDYSSILIVDFYDMKTKSTINKHMRCKLSKNIIIDDRINSYAYYEDKYRFINVLRINNYLHIEFMWNGIDITSTINLDYESINAVIPWTYNHFHYTSKHISLESEGNFAINNNGYNLENSLAFIDYGRGIWQHKKSWNWLISGFKSEAGEIIGINLASKYTDKTGVNENGIKIDGKVYKIYDDVEFIYDKENNIYNIKSKSTDEVNIEFIPILYNDKTNRLLCFRLNQKQYIGYLNGIVTIKRKEVKFNNIIGIIEDNFVKW